MWSERSKTMAKYLVRVTTTIEHRKWVEADNKYEASEIGYDDAYLNGLDDYELAYETVNVWVGNNI